MPEVKAESSYWTQILWRGYKCQAAACGGLSHLGTDGYVELPHPNPPLAKGRELESLGFPPLQGGIKGGNSTCVYTVVLRGGAGGGVLGTFARGLIPLPNQKMP
ncbi:MAG: hypothetical protein PUQ00_18755 [Nostoc sp. S13]|nr:hypothetical protein [Nostoc sp. S13]